MPAQAQSPPWLTPGVKVCLSLLFAWHLAALFIAPMMAAVGTAIRQELARMPYPPDPSGQAEAAGNLPSPGNDGPSPLQPPLGPEATPAPPQPPQPPWPLNVYLDVAYLNHGYGFFAPDPGPSHLIHYTIEFDSGETLTGTFPDREAYWPRLRYHRHFMLAEQLGLNPDEFGRSYARHLLKKYGARRVMLEYRRHLLASPADVRGGAPLDTPQSYLSRPLVTVTAEDFSRSDGPQP